MKKLQFTITSRWDRYLGMTAAMTQVLSPRLALEKRKIDH